MSSLAALKEKLAKKSTRNISDTYLSIQDVTDQEKWHKRLQEEGLKPDVWLEYIEELNQRSYTNEFTKYDKLCNTYEQAFKVIPSDINKKNGSFTRLWLNYARLKGEFNSEEAESILDSAKCFVRRFSVVHVACAEFEAKQGNVNKAKRLLHKATLYGAQPKELIDVALINLQNGLTTLLTDKERESGFSPVFCDEEHSLDENNPNSQSQSLDTKTEEFNTAPLPKPVSIADSSLLSSACKPSIRHYKSTPECRTKSFSLNPFSANKFTRLSSSNKMKVGPQSRVKLNLLSTDTIGLEETFEDLKPLDSFHRTNETFGAHSSGYVSSTTNDLTEQSDISDNQNKFTEELGQPSSHSTIDLSLQAPSKRQCIVEPSEQPSVNTTPSPVKKTMNVDNINQYSPAPCKFLSPPLKYDETLMDKDHSSSDKENIMNINNKIVEFEIPMEVENHPKTKQPLHEQVNQIIQPSDQQVNQPVDQQINQLLHQQPIHQQLNQPVDSQLVDQRINQPMDQQINQPVDPEPVDKQMNQPVDQQPVVQQINQLIKQPVDQQKNQPLPSVSQPIPEAKNYHLPQPVNQLLTQPKVNQSLPQPTLYQPVPTPLKFGNDVKYVNGHMYSVLKVAGRGGSAKVYQVLDEKNNVRALKCVDLDGSAHVVIEGYKNEIYLLKRLQYCDAVIKMYDYEFDEENNKLNVILEYGETDLAVHLSSRKKGGKSLGEAVIKFYWQEMLSAVNALHKEGIIHSDLKPANFMFVSANLKLIDFGIADAVQQDKTSVFKNVTVGTVSYMSPEAIKESCDGQAKYKISVRSDVWSLGCILYVMVYGKTPFQHIRHQLARIQAITDDKQVIDFPDIPDKLLLDVLKKCLTRDVKLRPTTDDLLNHPYLSQGPCVDSPVATPKPKSIQNILDQISEFSPRSIQTFQGLVQKIGK